MSPRIYIVFLVLAACTEAGRGTDRAPPSAMEERLARYPTVLESASRLEAPARKKPIAAITLPRRAKDAVLLEDTASHVAVRFALEGAQDVPLLTKGNLATAAGALGPEVDLLYRVRPEGIEDFLLYPSRPTREQARYVVALSGAAGLRLVAGTLEFVDAEGTPRLRMAAPYIVDARGVRHDVDVEVAGCAVDRDPRPPWGRPVTPAGAASCAIELRWEGRGVLYPAAVDPVWTATIGTMGIGRQLGCGGRSSMALLSTGLVLIAGGNSPTGTPTAELFHPATGTWAATGSLSLPIPCPSLTALGGGRALLVGSGAASVYDSATGQWTSKTLVTSDAKIGVPLTDQRVLVVGGLASQIFDPTTGTFTALGDMPRRHGATCAARVAGGKVAVPGGDDEPDSLDIFDPDLGTWSPGPRMAVPRYIATCTPLLDGRLLVTGGETDLTALPSSETYDPVTKSWSPPALLAAGRRYHAIAEPLPSGKVVVTGGEDGFIEITAELYDPGLGRWFPAGDTTIARAYHGAVTLPSGDVLAAGGYTTGFVLLSSSEILPLSEPTTPCTADGQCPTEHCVDGVCCDQSCKAACYACSAAKKGTGPDGVCGPALDGPDPRDRCPTLPAATCGSDGRCNGLGACAVHPRATACAPLSCSNGVLSVSTCDGQGTCVPETKTCSGFACATSASCGAGPCAGDADCSPSFACQSGTCLARKPSCDGDHTLVGADDARTDCAPYKCAGSDCLKQCNSATACVDAHVCNHLGACILPDEAARADAEAFLAGCAVTRTYRARSPWDTGVRGSLLVTLALVGARRRIRRRVR